MGVLNEKSVKISHVINNIIIFKLLLYCKK